MVCCQDFTQGKNLVLELKQVSFKQAWKAEQTVLIHFVRSTPVTQAGSACHMLIDVMQVLCVISFGDSNAISCV